MKVFIYDKKDDICLWFDGINCHKTCSCGKSVVVRFLKPYKQYWSGSKTTENCIQILDRKKNSYEVVANFVTDNDVWRLVSFFDIVNFDNVKKIVCEDFDPSLAKEAIKTLLDSHSQRAKNIISKFFRVQ